MAIVTHGHREVEYRDFLIDGRFVRKLRHVMEGDRRSESDLCLVLGKAINLTCKSFGECKGSDFFDVSSCFSLQKVLRVLYVEQMELGVHGDVRRFPVLVEVGVVRQYEPLADQMVSVKEET